MAIKVNSISRSLNIGTTTESIPDPFSLEKRSALPEGMAQSISKKFPHNREKVCRQYAVELLVWLLLSVSHFFVGFKWISICSVQKQPSRGVLIKSFSENMQQIYRKTPMPKCDFNKGALLMSLPGYFTMEVCW